MIVLGWVCISRNVVNCCDLRAFGVVCGQFAEGLLRFFVQIYMVELAIFDFLDHSCAYLIPMCLFDS